MARIRTIKPDFWTDEKIVELSMPARLFFIGMWNFADDNGNLVCSPRRLKMQIFPADTIDCAPLIEELLRFRLITRYEVDGEPYLHIDGFSEPSSRCYQVINRRGKTVIPQPSDSLNAPSSNRIDSLNGDASGAVDSLNGFAHSDTDSLKHGRPDDIDSVSTHGALTEHSRNAIPCKPPGSGMEVEVEVEVEGSKPISTSIVNGTPRARARGGADDDCCPKNEGEWLRHLRGKHGFEADATNANDRKKFWPVFARWVNAGIRTSQVDAAIAKAYADATEPISNIVAYADRVLDTLNAPKKRRVGDWWRTNSTMEAKARELGISASRPGEEPAAFKARIQQTIDERERAALH